MIPSFVKGEEQEEEEKIEKEEEEMIENEEVLKNESDLEECDTGEGDEREEEIVDEEDEEKEDGMSTPDNSMNKKYPLKSPLLPKTPTMADFNFSSTTTSFLTTSSTTTIHNTNGTNGTTAPRPTTSVRGAHSSITVCEEKSDEGRVSTPKTPSLTPSSLKTTDILAQQETDKGDDCTSIVQLATEEPTSSLGTPTLSEVGSEEEEEELVTNTPRFKSVKDIPPEEDPPTPEIEFSPTRTRMITSSSASLNSSGSGEGEGSIPSIAEEEYLNAPHFLRKQIPLHLLNLAIEEINQEIVEDAETSEFFFQEDLEDIVVDILDETQETIVPKTVLLALVQFKRLDLGNEGGTKVYKLRRFY